MFLFQFLFSIDENPLWSNPLLLKHVSYSVLIQKIMKILCKASLLFQSMFLIRLLFEMDENPPLSIPRISEHIFVSNLRKMNSNPIWSIPPLLKHDNSSILIQNWWKSYLKHRSSCKACFLFFKVEGKSSLEHPSFSNACFSFSSYSELM